MKFQKLRYDAGGMQEPLRCFAMPVDVAGADIKLITKQDTKVIGSLESTLPKSATILKPGQQATFENIQIKAVPAYNIGKAFHPKEKSWNGYLISLEGKTIYITIPPLSEEQRLNYSKLVNQIIENSKNKLRLNRDDVRKNIKNQYEAKSLTQDDKYRIEKEIDDLTKKFSDQLEDLKNRKIKDLMEN